MKKLLLLLVISSFSIATIFAQACVPDPQFIGGDVGVYPLPADPAVGTTDSTGIETAACQGEYWEQLMTAIVPTELTVGTAVLALNSVQVDNVTGLPNGITYQCEPPNCFFPGGMDGCVLISGTTTDPVGSYPIIVEVTADLPSFGGPTPLTFPDTTGSGLLPEGEYVIEVLAAGNCGVNIVSTDIINTIQVYPNPAVDNTNITFATNEPTAVTFSVFNITGALIHEETIQSTTGVNTLNYDVSDFNEGIYMFTLSDGASKYTDRLMVSK